MELTPRQKLIDLQQNLKDFERAQGYSNLIEIILKNSLLIKDSDYNTIGTIISHGLRREKDLVETYSNMIKLFKKMLGLVENESVKKELISKIVEIDSTLYNKLVP